MIDQIKNSVNARKQAFYNAYEIENSKLKEEIENLFKRIEEYANTFNDLLEFETAFATSDLNNEYIALFTKIAQTEKLKLPEVKENEDIDDENFDDEEENKNGALKMVADEIKEDVTYRVRRNIRNEVYDKVRDIPVVGDVMNAKQHIDFFSKFKKKKDE